MSAGDVSQGISVVHPGIPAVRPAFRFTIVVLALIFLYLRLPSDFTKPQFWGEDGPIFYQQAAELGWRSLFLVYSGYFTVLQRLIGIIASSFSPSLAPAIMAERSASTLVSMP